MSVRFVFLVMAVVLSVFALKFSTAAMEGTGRPNASLVCPHLPPWEKQTNCGPADSDWWYVGLYVAAGIMVLCLIRLGAYGIVMMVRPRWTVRLRLASPV